jgi:hypothetical protein
MVMMLLVGLTALPAPAATKQEKQEKKKKAAQKAEKAEKAAVKQPVDGRRIAKTLRGEWNLGELEMMRVVLEDAQYSADLKSNCTAALDQFTRQQEELLAQVEADGSLEGMARKRRATYYSAYMEKMQALYANPEFKADMAARMKALDKEIDTIYASAEKLMAALDSVGVTAEQKARIAPVVKDANRKVKAEVDKSETRSTRDRKHKDKIVASYKEARKRLRQELTPEQREKLNKKLAAEA